MTTMTNQYQNLIIILIMVYLHTAVLGNLTTDDFYEDTNAMIQINTTDDTATTLMLPISITNFKSYPSTNVYNTIAIQKGWFRLQGPGIMTLPFVYILRLPNIGDFPTGYITVQFSTDSTLLQRAKQDIGATDTNAPTHLILMDNIFIGQVAERGSTFQAVLATNGQYSYLILQFVIVDSFSERREEEAFISLSNSTELPLPYTSDIDNAANMTNVGVPGKYVIDLNEEAPPPPPPCPCRSRMLTVVCEYIRQNGNRIPQPCLA